MTQLHFRWEVWAYRRRQCRPEHLATLISRDVAETMKWWALNNGGYTLVEIRDLN